jgi:hypothetical protein
MCGEPIAPAANKVSRRAVAVKARPPPVNWTPRQTLPSSVDSMTSFSTWQPVHDRQVRSLRCRFQEGLGRVQADAAALVDLEVCAACVISAVEIVDLGNAELAGGFAEGVQDFPRQALALDAPLAAAAVDRAGAAVVVFAVPEQGQHVFPAPGRIAGEVGPAVVVSGLAAHVDHAVDRGTAAQHLAARVDQRASGQSGVGLGAEQPVGARIVDAVEIADGDVDPQVIVLAAGFDQQHLDVGLAAQAIREHATGSPGAHDDVVVIPGRFHVDSHS